MVKLIHKIHTANDGKHDDNSNNITQYIEFNKDSMLDLSEKNFENLVEALTNDAVNAAAADSSSSYY